MPHRIFLLSPANSSGQRARMVLNPSAKFELALKLRETGAPIGEIYAFVSGLYFRGKIAYATAFGIGHPEIPSAVVITPDRGLMSPEAVITLQELVAMADIPIDAKESRYRSALERDARMLNELAGPDCEYVLLGSVATAKYVEPLLGVFGQRLLFPVEFVGRGDMSRGGLMLRCASSGEELNYVPVSGATVRGPRPPRLPKIKR